MILQYLLHSHSDWSDGKDSMEDTVIAATKIGLKKFAVTDHVWEVLLFYSVKSHSQV